MKLPMPSETKRRIMGENAIELFKLPIEVPANATEAVAVS